MSGYGPLSTLPLGAQVALTLIVGDVVAYWGHRLFHTGRLWKVHAIHHSSEHLDWLAATRLHPLNDVIMRVAQASALLALGRNSSAVTAASTGLTRVVRSPSSAPSTPTSKRVLSSRS